MPVFVRSFWLDETPRMPPPKEDFLEWLETGVCMPPCELIDLFRLVELPCPWPPLSTKPKVPFMLPFLVPFPLFVFEFSRLPPVWFLFDRRELRPFPLQYMLNADADLLPVFIRLCLDSLFDEYADRSERWLRALDVIIYLVND